MAFIYVTFLAKWDTLTILSQAALIFIQAKKFTAAILFTKHVIYLTKTLIFDWA